MSVATVDVRNEPTLQETKYFIAQTRSEANPKLSSEFYFTSITVY